MSVVVCEGTITEVKKKQYCFYLNVIDHKTKCRCEWVIEPKLWFRGPLRELLPGRFVRLSGRKEIPAVSVRGGVPRQVRFRATTTAKLLATNREDESFAHSSSVSVADYRDKRPYASTHLAPRQSQSSTRQQQNERGWSMEAIVKQVREILEHPPKKVRLIGKGCYQCFSVQLLHEHLPFIPEMELSRCITQMVRNGDAANVSVTEGLFTLITFHDFLAPALLMVLHGFKMCRSLPDDDGCFSMEEWIDVCMRKFCGRFNVAEARLFESAKRLAEQGLVMVTENGKFRRPYTERNSASAASVPLLGAK